MIDGSVVDDPAEDRYVVPERRSVGVVFQNYLLFPHLSVLENVAFGLRSRGVSRGEARRRARRMARAHGSRRVLRRQAELALRWAATTRGPGARARDRASPAPPRRTARGARRGDPNRAAARASCRAGEVRSGRACSSPTSSSMRLRSPIGWSFSSEDRSHSKAKSPTSSARPRSRYVADLVGINLLRGIGRDHEVELETGGTVVTADPVVGDVYVAIQPHSVSTAPAGSRREPAQRLAWPDRRHRPARRPRAHPRRGRGSPRRRGDRSGRRRARPPRRGRASGPRSRPRTSRSIPPEARCPPTKETSNEVEHPQPDQWHRRRRARR